MKPQPKTTKRKAPVKRSPEFKRRKTYGIPPMSPELSSEGRTRLQLGDCEPTPEMLRERILEVKAQPVVSAGPQGLQLRSPVPDLRYPFGTAPKDASPVPGWKSELPLPPAPKSWWDKPPVLSIPVPAAKKIPLWRVWWNAFLDTFK